MASTIPAAMSALFDLWDNAPGVGGAGIKVSDGPFTGAPPNQMVTVGYNGEGDEAVTGTTTAEGYKGDPDREDYSILCSAAATTGSDSQVSVRASAFDLYNACCAALTDDPTLGGVVLRAMPSEFTVRQIAGTGGRACLVLFSVSVTAYTA
jgi:hypothetical protein